MPFAGTSDVIEAAKRDSVVVNNGSIVVAARPHGSYTVDNTRAVNTPSIAFVETDLTSKFDDPTYYSA
jgi:hypothetical protein